MTVTETIRVVSEGDQIRHGIYRDFPTRYKDRYNNKVSVGFEVQEVLKDGRPETWWTEGMDNGVRVYVGSKDVLIEPGEHTYALTYSTDRQLGFYDEHDELYWNVTGNGWEFPIEQATATVELPAGAGIRTTEAFTGFSGEKGKDFTTTVDSHGRAVFRTTYPLLARQGLTIAVTWPKGFVAEPTRVEKAGAFLADNGSTVAGVAGIAALLVYYLFTWFRIGRDPEKGAVIPLYEAPDGLSPAAVRYIMRMGYDDGVFAAALVDMAVKGSIAIDEDPDGTYVLTRKDADAGNLAREEVQIARQIFRDGPTLAIKTANHATIGLAVKQLRKSLAVEYEKLYFLTNRWALIPGLALSIAFLAAIVYLGWNRVVAGFMTVWLAGWTVGCATLVYGSIRAWKGILSGRSRKLTDVFTALFLIPFTIPFLAGEAFGLWVFTEATSLPAVLCIFVIVLLNILFYHLMKAFTIKGRKVMDRIEGLRLYLSVAEKDKLNVLNPPEKTPAVFEKFLPYALALGVEQEWCEQFADVLARRGTEAGYRPGWYSGGRLTTGRMTGLASSLGAMSSSIASASSPPGSRSGGSGGSSGGGGGGGGGGGW
jgi:uncharacterized membrane protein YgcG